MLETLKEKVNENTEVVFWTFVFVVVLTLGIKVFMDARCESQGRDIIHGSICFDIKERCKVECNEINEKFTGKINWEDYGCGGCICSNHTVNHCSGFVYDRHHEPEGGDGEE